MKGGRLFKSMANYIQAAYTPPLIAAFGNILLDVEVVVPDKNLLKKYNLEKIAQTELDEKTFSALFEEVKQKYSTEIRCPGGSAQNTLRLFQWLVQSPGYTVLFGGIGTDDNGTYLEEAVSKTGVRTRYAYHPKHRTGTCLSFIGSGSRTLIAHLGAADYFGLSELNTPENWEILKEVLMIYVEGFFITHDYPTAAKVLNYCTTSGTCFGMNLSAPYVCEKNGNDLLNLMKSADIIFGHRNEYLALRKYVKSQVDTMLDVVTAIQKQSLLKDKKIRKGNLPILLQQGPIVVVTDGKKSVNVFKGNSSAPFSFPVPHLDYETIKDTTGAGDAFVAGFLAAAFADYDIEICVKWGCRIARYIIQEVGVSIPNYDPELMFTPKPQ